MSTVVDEIVKDVVSKGLNESEVLLIAQKLIASVISVKSEKELKYEADLEERYQFAKERIVKSKAKKLKSLKNTIVSYFREKERGGDQKGKGISNNEVGKIIKRLVGERIIFIDSNENVEFL